MDITFIATILLNMVLFFVAMQGCNEVALVLIEAIPFLRSLTPLERKIFQLGFFIMMVGIFMWYLS